MCGIAGEIVLDADGVVDLEAIVPMAAVLAHRGPDDWGFYVSESRRAMLLNCRLSIVDIPGGAQPLSNEDGSVWVTFNGEIYDFQRLRQDLERRGHCFRTRSDSEVIVHLYEEYGEALVQRLRGEFALAIHDQRRGLTYLVRDRFGIKPLFYAEVQGSLLFASEIKAIFRHRKVKAELDYENVYHMVSGVLQPGMTLFKHVRQLEPGYLMRISGHTASAARYWDLPLPLPGRGNASEDALIEEFHWRLEEAVRLRLQGDTEVGVYLSGGVDSSAVACTMAGLASRPIKAFTIGFEDPSYNETVPASAVAQRAGLEHHVLSIGRKDLAPHFVRSLWHNEMPVLNSHGTAKFLLSELAHRHVKVVLTGEGADELLLGYNQFKHQLLLEAVRSNPHHKMARAELERFLGSEGVLTGITPARHAYDYQRVVRLFGAYPYPALRSVLYQRKAVLLLNREFRRAMRSIDPLGELANRIDPHNLTGLPPVVATQYVLFKTDLPTYILSFLGDREEMAHSVEGRLPFLDHELVEFAWQIPYDLKLKQKTDKYILRRAVADLLSGIDVAKKQVFLAPSTATLGLDYADPRWEPYFQPDFVREVGVLDPHRLSLVRQGVRLLPRGSYYHSLCEGATVFALSLHIVYDLFCKQFASYADRLSEASTRYSWPARPAYERPGTLLYRASDPSDTSNDRQSL